MTISLYALSYQRQRCNRRGVGCRGFRLQMTAFGAWASPAGQIGNVAFPPRAAIRSLSRPSIALDPIGHSVELVLSTLSRPSWLLQRVVGSTRKQPFTLGLHQLRPARREAPLPLSGR